MCVSSLVLSRRPKIFKKRPKTSKIPSLLSAHAGRYIYCIKNTNIDALRLNAVTPGAQAERNIHTHISEWGVPLKGDISSLRALGPGGGQISRVVHVSTRADFGVFCRKVWFRARGTHILEKREEREEKRERREKREERREKREEARPDHRFLVLFTNMF